MDSGGIVGKVIAWHANSAILRPEIEIFWFDVSVCQTCKYMGVDFLDFTSPPHASPYKFLRFRLIKSFSHATRARELHRLGHLPELEERRAVRFRERDGTKDPSPDKGASLWRERYQQNNILIPVSCTNFTVVGESFDSFS